MTSNSDFESLIQNKNVYVDKTDLLAELARVDGGSSLFHVLVVLESH